jgi:hypothetical protein
MSTYLRFSEIRMGTFSASGDAKLQVMFLDEDGNAFHWVPGWREVVSLIRKAANTENFNLPGSNWSDEFGAAAQELLAGVGKNISEARKITGCIDSVRKGQLVILPLHYDECMGPSTWADRRDEIMVSVPFEMDKDWCMDNIGQCADILVVDGWLAGLKIRDSLK